MTRNLLRVLAFDVLPLLAVLAALFYIGVVLGWPLWWAAVGTVLAVLVIQFAVVNFLLFRRDGVTVGTDDDRPRLRLLVVACAAAALVLAVVVGYTRWTLPDRTLNHDIGEVVGVASSVAEATATFTPDAPNASIDRATALMVPQRAEAFRKEFTGIAKDLTHRGVSGHAETISAGVEALGPDMASVAVVLRAGQSVKGQPEKTAVLAVRVTLTKAGGHWLVMDVTPISPQ